MAFCKKCGAQHNETANFCPKCGQPTRINETSGDQESRVTYNYDDEPEEEQIKTWQIIVSVLFWPAGAILIITAYIKKQLSLAKSALIYTAIGICLTIVLNIALGDCSNNSDLRSLSTAGTIEVTPAVSSGSEPQSTVEQDNAEEYNTDWLQGHWVYEQGNYKGHFIIQGDKLIQYSSMNSERYEYTFRIEDGEIRARLIDGMDLVAKIDFENQRIDYGDGQWMHKISDPGEDYSSTTSSLGSRQRPFVDEGDILARIYNQRFIHSRGLEIRVDGYGRIEIDGDPAGVLSVLRYNSESALLRYGNGMYGEGKIVLKIDGSKLVLQDPVDGSVFYQR